VQTVADLMTTDLMTLDKDASLTEAKQLMQEHNIRNLPIVDNDGKWTGMLTQREYLRCAFNLVSQYGTKLLSKKESDTSVANIMCTDMVSLEKDTPLETAAELLIKKKYACIPIVDQGMLVGILTPIDFVKLVHNLKLDK